MFSLTELEAAHRLVLGAFPGTPQFAWPLLAERCGAEVCGEEEEYEVLCTFKLRGGLV